MGKVSGNMLGKGISIDLDDPKAQQIVAVGVCVGIGALGIGGAIALSKMGGTNLLASGGGKIIDGVTKVIK